MDGSYCNYLAGINDSGWLCPQYSPWQGFGPVGTMGETATPIVGQAPVLGLHSWSPTYCIPQPNYTSTPFQPLGPRGDHVSSPTARGSGVNDFVPTHELQMGGYSGINAGIGGNYLRINDPYSLSAHQILRARSVPSGSYSPDRLRTPSNPAQGVDGHPKMEEERTGPNHQSYDSSPGQAISANQANVPTTTNVPASTASRSLHCAQCQALRDWPPLGVGGTTRNTRCPSCIDGEAQDGLGSPSGHSPLRPLDGDGSSSLSDSRGNKQNLSNAADVDSRGDEGNTIGAKIRAAMKGLMMDGTFGLNRKSAKKQSEALPESVEFYENVVRKKAEKLPLHNKKVDLAALLKFEEWLKKRSTKTAQRATFALQLLTAEYWDEFVRNNPMTPEEEEWVLKDDSYCKADVEDQMANGYVKEATEKPKFLGRAFTVPETSGDSQRRRPIYWPRWFNEVLEKAEMRKLLEYSLPQVEALMNLVASSKPEQYAVCFDLAISFFQISIAKISGLFGFVCEGKYYTYEVLPMGWSLSVFILQSLLEALLEATCEGTPVSSLGYVDNVWFHGDLLIVTETALKFQKLCKDLFITLNKELLNAPHKIGKFIGVEYDLDGHRVRITPKSLAKLKESVSRTKSQRATYGTWMELFGKLFWAQRVLHHQMWEFYHPIKWYRRKAAMFEAKKIKSTDEVSIWPSAEGALKNWVSMATDNEWRELDREKRAPGALLFTDASLLGAGAILLIDGQIITFSCQWSDEEKKMHITLLEARAVLRAVQFFGDVLRGKSLVLFVDNTTVKAVEKKGRSNSFELNTEMSHLHQVLDRFEVVIKTVVYLKSAENPADEPSRLLPFKQNKIAPFVFSSPLSSYAASDGLGVCISEAICA